MNWLRKLFGNGHTEPSLPDGEKYRFLVALRLEQGHRFYTDMYRGLPVWSEPNDIKSAWVFTSFETATKMAQIIRSGPLPFSKPMYSQEEVVVLTVKVSS